MGTSCCSIKHKVHSNEPETEWSRLFKDHNFDRVISRNTSKVRGMLFRGIPSSLRWEVWCKLLRTPNLSTEYSSLLLNITVGSDIDKDIHRTFPNDPWIASEQGQQCLKNLLNVLGLKYSQQGYWQGMNYIVGTALLVSIGNEEQTYSFFTKFYSDFGVIGLFEKDFEKIREMLENFHYGVKKYDRKLSKHIRSIGLDDEMWVFKWFITLFTSSFQYQAVVRFWDAILAKDIEFLGNIAVSVALALSEDIQTKSLEQVLRMFEMIEVDAEHILIKANSYLIEKAVKIKKTAKVGVDNNLNA